MDFGAEARLIRRRIEVAGIVQGVGFRPFVYREATGRGLCGWVRNEAGQVIIEVEGSAAALADFERALREGPPPRARVESLRGTAIACLGDKSFRVVESVGDSEPKPVLPADLATCAACVAEIADASARRHAYPFTNCTDCGPRTTIAEKLPYDRAATSMKSFAMCDDCAREYRDPTDRRFHAEPIACPRCGPQVSLLDAMGQCVAVGDDAITASAHELRAGSIVALKGLGGFQILVDATSEQAVERLRSRKHRPTKPLAVMVQSADAAAQLCAVSADEQAVLESPAAPILLLRRRHDAANDVASAVAPDNPFIGLMLPTTPLHHLLSGRVGRPIVCTSGNLSEEPMCTETDEALLHLRGIADHFLVHDRPIVRPVDDSVGRVDSRGLALLRRARGFAPEPIRLGADGPTVLALGGHQKSTIALAMGSDAVLSQHLGDLDSARGRDLLERTAFDLVRFFAARTAAITCDAHPDYASTRLGECLATAWGLPLLRVQHHHAHIAACAAENRLDAPVLGLAWDGAGYGDDGTIWGGETLLCDGGNFTRVGHLRAFPLPGGERAIREPRRSALGLLWEALGPDTAMRAVQPLFANTELAVLAKILDQPRLSPRTSSVGRLFDAVAALLGFGACVSFEGEAAMRLEFAAMNSDDHGAYDFPLAAASPAIADPAPLLRAILADRTRGIATAIIARRFHESLAHLAVDFAHAAGIHDVVLSGGCFQNALLTRLAVERLSAAGFTVHTHRIVPPNDGGLALGQAVIARSRLIS